MTSTAKAITAEQRSLPERERIARFDVEAVRKDFPILRRLVNGKPLVYLDNAATSQKPQVVIDAIRRYYELENANVHRGVHILSQIATEEYEASRKIAQRFIHAKRESEIVFVRGATEGVNLVAQTYGRSHVSAGDEVLITAMEHHSNIVPWQILCEEKKATLKVAPMNDEGELLFEEFAALLTSRTKLVSVTHVSNALGSINPVRKLVKLAHEMKIPVLLDGAQAVPHLPVDVQELDCDFYVFSGHKVFAPTGIGILYGKETFFDSMPPYQGGGDMISSVTFEKTIYNKLPYKFEAGTPNISGAVGLGAALQYLGKMDYEALAAHEHDVLNYATQRVGEIPGVRLVGTAKEKTGALSFVMDEVHPHDVGTILDQEGIAVRTGHHCAQPVMDRFGLPGTVRASFALYNTRGDADALVRSLRKVQEVFS